MDKTDQRLGNASRWLGWLSLLLLLLLGGCGSGMAARAEAPPPGEPGYGYSFQDGRTANESASEPATSLAVNDSMPAGAPAPMPMPESGALATPSMPSPPPPPPPAEPPSDGATTPGLGSTQAKTPLLIYRADVALAVFEVEKGLDAVEAIAKKAGGYLVSRSEDGITIRVPAGAFDANLKEILKLGDVLHRNLQVDDVTAEFSDLEIRLKNYEAVRQRLEELLAGARKTDEALEVERELARVTEQIELIKGRLRLLGELVAYSTITVNFTKPAVETVEDKFHLPFPWLKEIGLSGLLNF